MTDKRTLDVDTSAFPSGAARDPAREYELSASCDGGEHAKWLVMTGNGDKGRAINFPRFLPYNRIIRYRVDDDAQQTIALFPTDYRNVGRLLAGILVHFDSHTTKSHPLIGKTRSEVEALLGRPTNKEGYTDGRFLNYDFHFVKSDDLGLLLVQDSAPRQFELTLNGSSIVTDVTERVIALPNRRLLLADVMEDEVVEFSFSALSAADRKTIVTWCFPVIAQK